MRRNDAQRDLSLKPTPPRKTAARDRTAAPPAPPIEIGSKLRIRPAIASDLPAVIMLDGEVTGLAKPDYWQDLYERSGRPRGEQHVFLVAEFEGRIEGFIVGEVRAWEFGSPPCGWVFAIQVRPKGRLKGVGTQLYTALTDRFRNMGIGKVRTMLARDNTEILSFFRSQGMMAGPFIELETTLDRSRGKRK